MKSILNVVEAGGYTGLSKSTLDKMRGTGLGPRFVRLGRRKIGYLIVDLDAWIKSSRHVTTAEYMPPHAPSPEQP